MTETPTPQASAKSYLWDDAIQQALTSGPLTNKDLMQHTGISRRSLYSCLERLQRMGVVVCAVNIRDTRQHLYWIRTNSSARAAIAFRPFQNPS